MWWVLHKTWRWRLCCGLNSSFEQTLEWPVSAVKVSNCHCNCSEEVVHLLDCKANIWFSLDLRIWFTLEAELCCWSEIPSEPFSVLINTRWMEFTLAQRPSWETILEDWSTNQQRMSSEYPSWKSLLWNRLRTGETSSRTGWLLAKWLLSSLKMLKRIKWEN